MATLGAGTTPRAVEIERFFHATSLCIYGFVHMAPDKL